MNISSYTSHDWSGARSFYSDLFPDRDKIIEKVNELKTNTKILSEIHENIKVRNEKTFLVVVNDIDFPVIVRSKIINRKNGTTEYSFKFIQDYVLQHLYSSLIINILLDETIGEKLRIDITTHFLYNYWFLNKQIKIDNFNRITRCICVDLEKLILNIVNKEMTKYKKYNTNRPTAILTDRLRRERLAE